MTTQPYCMRLDLSPDECRAEADGRRRQMIREAAYRCAERRGFGCGHEVEDWLQAEKEVDRYLYGDEGAFGLYS